MFVAHHFDPHSTTNHPTSPSSDPLPVLADNVELRWVDPCAVLVCKTKIVKKSFDAPEETRSLHFTRARSRSWTWVVSRSRV